MMRIIYCVGNPDVPEDALAIELANGFQKEGVPGFRFEVLKHPEILINTLGDILILDVVKGITNVTLINDISRLKKRNITTLHDFDLGALLQIMKEAGTLKSVRIIGIPMGMKKDQAKKEVISLLDQIGGSSVTSI